jgi:hypothetical protein
LACPAAASAAPSSRRTPIHSIEERRTASASGLSESPISAKICFYADALKHADQRIRGCLSHVFLRHTAGG